MAWIDPHRSPAQISIANALLEANKRKNMANNARTHHAAKGDITRLEEALMGLKDQSRVGGLPPEPMPPAGDVTVIEKGRGTPPVQLPFPFQLPGP